MIACFVLNRNDKVMDREQNPQSNWVSMAYPCEQQIITPPPPESSGYYQQFNPCNKFPLSPHTTTAFYHTPDISPSPLPVYSNGGVAAVDSSPANIFGVATNLRNQNSAFCRYSTTNLCISSWYKYHTEGQK